MVRSLVILLFMAVATPSAQAFDWIAHNVSGTPVDIPHGQVRSLSLGKAYQIKNLVIQAYAVGRTGGSLDIMVNGDVKGSITLPGTDPSYVVTVAEGASSIEFVSRSGQIRIEKVIATLSSTGATVRQRNNMAGWNLPQNEVTDLSRQVIIAIDNLLPWTPVDAHEKYLLPIKSAAGRLYAVASSRGTISKRTALEIEALLMQFDLAQAYFDQTLTCKDCFDSVVHLLALKERFASVSQ